MSPLSSSFLCRVVLATLTTMATVAYAQYGSYMPQSSPFYYPNYASQLNTHVPSAPSAFYHPGMLGYGSGTLGASSGGGGSRFGTGFVGNGGIGIKQTGETLANVYGSRLIPQAYAPPSFPNMPTMPDSMYTAANLLTPPATPLSFATSGPALGGYSSYQTPRGFSPYMGLK